MKKIIKITVLLIILLSQTFAQTSDNISRKFSQLGNIKLTQTNSADADSSLLDYFPLAEGNLWQYRYTDSPGQMGWIENMVSLGDTVMPDGLTYSRLFNPPYKGTGFIKYCRIDSSYNIREYIDNLCIEGEPDTIVIIDPPGYYGCINDTGVTVFKLKVSDSTYWFTYFNIGGNLFSPSLKYIGLFETEIFGLNTYAKVFTQYFRQYYSKDSIWEEYYGWDYVLLKGIGIYLTGYGESSNAILQGAIINGIKYGTVVGIEDDEKFKQQDFILYQNYPNPFNNQTTITFSLNKPQNIKLEIYNVLGELITILEDSYLNSGTHVRIFLADKLSTGIYFIYLSSGNQRIIKKMIFLK